MKVFEFSRKTDFTFKEVKAKPECTAPAKCGHPEICEHKQTTCFCPYRAVTV